MYENTALKCQQKTDPFALFASDLKPDLVDIHDALGDGESESVAAFLGGIAGFVAAVETLEDLFGLRL